jgi:HSP20 family protein
MLRDDDFFANRWFREMTVPAVNIKESDSAFNLEVAAPGMKKSDFKLEVKEGMLYISAELRQEEEETDKGYTRKEFSFNAFTRSFWLPEDVKADEIKASYEEGILHIAIPKMKTEKKSAAKLIEIK